MQTSASITQEAPAAPADRESAGGISSTFLRIAELLNGWGWGMVAPLRFYFLVVVLQVPLPLAGLIEGLALGLPRVIGALLGSSASGPPSIISSSGYLLEGAARPLLAFATSWLGAVPAVLGEGVGRGLADANAEDTEQGGWLRFLGGAFGAVSGSLLLIYLVSGLTELFLWSLLPGALALAVALLRLVTGGPKAQLSQQHPAQIKAPGRYGPRFWLFTGASAALALGNISVSFFLLRLASFDQPPYMLALAFALYLGAAALLSTSVRLLRSRWGDLPLLLTGYSLHLFATFIWILIAEAWQGWVLLAVAGAGVAFSSSVSGSLVRAYTSAGASSGAHRAYNGVVGSAVIFGNVFAALFWVAGGSNTAFGYAAWGLALGIGLISAWLPWLRRGFTE